MGSFFPAAHEPANHAILSHMTRSKKSRKNRRTPPSAQVAREGLPAAPGDTASKDWSVFRDILYGLIVCVLFFGLLEGVLRIAGYPAVDRSDDPFVGFSSIKPLYVVHEGVATTAPDRVRYFNTVSFPATKPPDTLRIFCFGGSTTYGHPYDASASFSRWLEDLLKASTPDKNFEVINAGGISYASYRIVPLVRETLQYQPDLMIFYTGHNEFLERRTYSKLFDEGSGRIEVQAVLERSSVYQALKRLLRPLTIQGKASSEASDGHVSAGSNGEPASGNEQAPSAKKSMLGEEVSAILDKSGGLALYYRDDEFTRGVVKHFGHNLEAMVKLCKDRGVPVILVQPPSNLKDFSPFKSEHSAGFSSGEKRELIRQLDLAANRVKEGGFSQALESAEVVIARDPLYAEAHYVRGKALLGLGRYQEAKESFVKAKDLDVCPLRCISGLEEQISRVAAETGMTLIPLKDVVERKCAETGDRTGIPGNESFLDHVHPSVPLHQLLAGLILDKMVESGLFKPARKLTEEDRQSVYAKGMASFDKAYMATKDLTLAKTLHWAGKKEEARVILERVAPVLDSNPEVHKLLGRSLLDDGKSAEAIEHYLKAAELSGNDPLMLFNLAVAYYDAGRKREAESTYLKVTSSESGPPEAAANLAMIYLEQGRIQEALNVVLAAMKQHPEADSLAAPNALALAVSGKPAEAIPWMLRAVDAEPGEPKHLYNLAAMYALTGEASKALKYLETAVQRGYADARKLAADSAFRTLRPLPEFQALLERMR